MKKPPRPTSSWRKFDNGADIIAAIASGDVQIGYLGSSPLTAAITRKVPVETFLIATQIGAAEALVARDRFRDQHPTRPDRQERSPCPSSPLATTACWPR